MKAIHIGVCCLKFLKPELILCRLYSYLGSVGGWTDRTAGGVGTVGVTELFWADHVTNLIQNKN